VKLYFDSNIYDSIVKAGETASVRRWLKASRHRVEASLEANVVEALRAPASLRPDLVAGITTIGVLAYPPRQYAQYGEIADELTRLRPEWFSAPLDGRRREQYLRGRKRDWAKLKANPAFVPANLAIQELRIRGAVAVDIGRQRQKLHTIEPGTRHTDSVVQGCIDALAAPERHWRYATSNEVRVSIEAELHAKGQLEWLTGFVMPTSRVAWDRFWMCEADASAVPLSRIIGMVEYFQRRHRVTPGNPVDRFGHAPYLMGIDRFLTRDATFFKVIGDVVAEFPTGSLATPILVGHGPTPLDAIRVSLRQ
jgi:hypothetical protein